jgi:hypothetical protein
VKRFLVRLGYEHKHTGIYAYVQGSLVRLKSASVASPAAKLDDSNCPSPFALFFFVVVWIFLFVVVQMHGPIFFFEIVVIID